MVIFIIITPIATPALFKQTIIFSSNFLNKTHGRHEWQNVCWILLNSFVCFFFIIISSISFRIYIVMEYTACVCVCSLMLINSQLVGYDIYLHSLTIYALQRTTDGHTLHTHTQKLLKIFHMHWYLLCVQVGVCVIAVQSMCVVDMVLLQLNMFFFFEHVDFIVVLNFMFLTLLCTVLLLLSDYIIVARVPFFCCW